MIGALKKRKIRVPDGFATTAEAYRAFVEQNDLRQPIEKQLAALKRDEKTLEKVGKSIRSLFQRGDFPEPVGDAIVSAYSELCSRENAQKADVAVRSSATAEDLPEASFAAQQESFLNVTGEKGRGFTTDTTLRFALCAARITAVIAFLTASWLSSNR